MEYRKRIVDSLIEEKLRIRGACLIQGIKWCGKTTTAMQHAKSILYMADPRILKQNLQLLSLNPTQLLDGETPRLIDERQIAPELWDLIRFEVDERQKFGQFILTGSSVPVSKDKIFHSGTGRYSWLTMRPMTLYESGDSNGSVSLKELFETPKIISGTSKINFDELCYLICRGGWPLALNMSKEDALLQSYDYLEGIVKSDLSRMLSMKVNESLLRKLLKSYARFQGSSTSITKIKEDVGSDYVLDTDTVSKYLNALKDIFVIEDVEAWNPNIRSKTAIKRSATRYFEDPSIATASLGVSPNDLKNDLNTLGLFFETLCIRDLRVYAEAMHGRVYHYLDRNGLECDAVIHLDNGKYGLVEIKLGGDQSIVEATKTLNKLEEKIDTTKMFKPSFKMVLVGIGDYAYRNEDDIYIVPIGSLKD